jgi:hypothetical protein
MKVFGFLTTLLVLFSGCVSEPVTTSEHMIFSTKIITFQRGDSLKTVSITHSCTCPFSWSSIVVPDTGIKTSPGDTAWLIFPWVKPTKMIGDQHSVPIETRPRWYDADTNRTTIIIQSDNNTYGTDTLQIVAIR